jgi:hypothetical protein
VSRQAERYARAVSLHTEHLAGGVTSAKASRPGRLVGIAGIAAWLEVDPQLVTKWLTRYSNLPRHDFEIFPGRQGSDKPDKAWLDNQANRDAWRDWYANGRTGQGAKGIPKPRKNTPAARA